VSPARVIARGFEFPEGPAFARDGTLFLVNVLGGYLSCLARDGTPRTFHRTGGRPNGLAIHRDGSMWVADAALAAILRIDRASRRQDVMVDAFAGGRLRGPNDLCFDGVGNLFFTDPLHSTLEDPTGRVFRRAADGELSLLLEGLAFPNGLCLDASGRVLYLAETMRGAIHACDLSADGDCESVRLHAHVEGGPDGMALDVRGNLYVALYGRGAIGVIPPAGGPVRYLEIEGANPTNVAFSGTELYLTEASQGTLQVLDVGEVGLPLFSHA
jgi:gluconolactonase